MTDSTPASGLAAADLAQLARCAWQRQQGAGDSSRAFREFETVAMWTAADCRLDLQPLR